MGGGRAQTFWTEPGRVATAYSADKYKEHNEQYKSAELGGGLNDPQLPKTREVFVSRQFWVHFLGG